MLLRFVSESVSPQGLDTVALLMLTAGVWTPNHRLSLADKRSWSSPTTFCSLSRGVTPSRNRRAGECQAVTQYSQVPWPSILRSTSALPSTRLTCQAARDSSASQPSEQDANQLVTQLNIALAQEDYARASQLRDKLKALQGTSDAIADWREYGCPDWLADRAEKLGFRFPTGMP